MPSVRVDLPLDRRTQSVEHARNGDKGGGALAFEGTENFRGLLGVLEDNRGADERGHEERHELAEDMAQRNDRNEAQRMKPALVFTILGDALFQWFEIREEIAVGQNNAPRLAGGAGGEEDLRDMAARDGLIGETGNCGVQAGFCVSMTGPLVQRFGSAGIILQEEGGDGGSEVRF